MSGDAVRAAFGVVMVCLAAFYSLPQWWRVRRTGSVEGVSLAATSNALISCFAWVLYALVLGDVWVLLTCAAALPSLAATTYVLVRKNASREGMRTTWMWTGALVVGGAVHPWAGAPLNLLLGASIAWYVVPAVAMAWRSADVSGIASGAWYVLLADSVVWLLYSLLADIPAGLLYAVIGGTGAMAVLARLGWRWGPDCGVCAPIGACTCTPASHA
jgi:uncharacterized protein with PQ loop repeat